MTYFEEEVTCLLLIDFKCLTTSLCLTPFLFALCLTCCLCVFVVLEWHENLHARSIHTTFSFKPRQN